MRYIFIIHVFLIKFCRFILRQTQERNNRNYRGMLILTLRFCLALVWFVLKLFNQSSLLTFWRVIVNGEIEIKISK